MAATASGTLVRPLLHARRVRLFDWLDDAIGRVDKIVTDDEVAALVVNVDVALDCEANPECGWHAEARAALQALLRPFLSLLLR